MFDLPTQQIRVCDGTPMPKPVKRSGSNARKARVEATAEAPISIKPKEAKPVRTKIGARLRAMVLERDNFACVRCGANADGNRVTLHVDHIKPVAQGGTNCESNLQTLCSTCNIGKGARSEPAKWEKKPDAIVSQLAAIVGKKRGAK